MRTKRYHYLLKLNYDGAKYHGWQKQKHFPTIQGSLESILHTFINSEIITFGASRTDSGVHALCQYCKLSITENWRPEELLKTLSMKLPQDIRVQELFFVDPRFKVALSAYEKEYHYYFTNGSNQAALPLKEHATYFTEELNEESIEGAIKLFLGNHSFHNYQYRSDTQRGYEREIFNIKLLRNIPHPFYPDIQVNALSFSANGFLKQMVRILVGVLIDAGIGNTNEESILKSLHPAQKLKLGFIAPAGGLYLTRISYPDFAFKKMTQR